MRILVCGESLFSSRNLAKRLDQKIVKKFLEADAVFTNAEFCTPQYTTPPAAGRGFMTSVKPETLDEFVDLNMKLVSFANNHTGDYGWQGVVDTIEAAQERKIIYCGIGHSLEEARAARFLDTAKGRIGVVATGSTRSEVFAASLPGAGIAARPGLNPLRWGQAYVLPDKEFSELQHINKVLGTEASMLECLKVETLPEPKPDKFKFGSLFEGNLQIERGNYAHVRTFVNEKDRDAILKNISDSSKRSDITIVSIHTHEGTAENWYSPEPAAFIEEFARKAIDAGASAVVGHGAHFLRGVELYKKRPIFYSLGSLFLEFEAGESKIAPEMYEAYGLGKDALPSDLHCARSQDKDGNFIGFNADRRYSKHCIAVFDYVEDKLEFKLLPIDLGLNRKRPLDRGLPVIASNSVGREITKDLNNLSQCYGTRFDYDEEDGTISIK
ncbi:CapA family protein [Clostridium ljungdahlii]|uniref:Capsule biosynthesis protein CapA n=1 Tax=Clostridium ljungdahlii TaxID=1538 RepID=A0A168M0J3_9CLOT|nr:CapA family protein [Clostridium ljungdahlii]OAA83947.1 Capsule biosynthesis protein CapA [Clostridium ljungdahlii]